MILVNLIFANKSETFIFHSIQHASNYARDLSDIFGDCEWWYNKNDGNYYVDASHLEIVK